MQLLLGITCFCFCSWDWNCLWDPKLKLRSFVLHVVLVLPLSINTHMSSLYQFLGMEYQDWMPGAVTILLTPFCPCTSSSHEAQFMCRVKTIMLWCCLLRRCGIRLSSWRKHWCGCASWKNVETDFVFLQAFGENLDSTALVVHAIPMQAVMQQHGLVRGHPRWSDPCRIFPRCPTATGDTLLGSPCPTLSPTGNKTHTMNIMCTWYNMVCCFAAKDWTTTLTPAKP